MPERLIDLLGFNGILNSMRLCRA